MCIAHLLDLFRVFFIFLFKKTMFLQAIALSMSHMALAWYFLFSKYHFSVSQVIVLEFFTIEYECFESTPSERQTIREGEE